MTRNYIFNVERTIIDRRRADKIWNNAFSTVETILSTVKLFLFTETGAQAMHVPRKSYIGEGPRRKWLTDWLRV